MQRGEVTQAQGKGIRFLAEVDLLVPCVIHRERFEVESASTRAGPSFREGFFPRFLWDTHLLQFARNPHGIECDLRELPACLPVSLPVSYTDLRK